MRDESENLVCMGIPYKSVIWNMEDCKQSQNFHILRSSTRDSMHMQSHLGHKYLISTFSLLGVSLSRLKVPKVRPFRPIQVSTKSAANFILNFVS